MSSDYIDYSRFELIYSPNKSSMKIDLPYNEEETQEQLTNRIYQAIQGCDKYCTDTYKSRYNPEKVTVYITCKGQNDSLEIVCNAKEKIDTLKEKILAKEGSPRIISFNNQIIKVFLPNKNKLVANSDEIFKMIRLEARSENIDFKLVEFVDKNGNSFLPHLSIPLSSRKFKANITQKIKETEGDIKSDIKSKEADKKMAKAPKSVRFTEAGDPQKKFHLAFTSEPVTVDGIKYKSVFHAYIEIFKKEKDSSKYSQLEGRMNLLRNLVNLAEDQSETFKHALERFRLFQGNGINLEYPYSVLEEGSNVKQALSENIIGKIFMELRDQPRVPATNVARLTSNVANITSWLNQVSLKFDDQDFKGLIKFLKHAFPEGMEDNKKNLELLKGFLFSIADRHKVFREMLKETESYSELVVTYDKLDHKLASSLGGKVNLMGRALTAVRDELRSRREGDEKSS